MRCRLFWSLALVFHVIAVFPAVTAKAYAAPFSSSGEHQAMQRFRTRRDQQNRIKAISAYFRQKNPRIPPQKAAAYAQLIEEHTSRYNLDPFLAAAVLVKESTGKERAVSKGNYGLMQVNWTANRPWIVRTFPVRNTGELLVPENNILLGVHILSSGIGKSRGDIDGGLDRYRGRSLVSYRNEVHRHYRGIFRIFTELRKAS